MIFKHRPFSISYNQRVHKKLIKSARWQGRLLIRCCKGISWLFCYLLGGFRALKISSFGQLYCGHHKACRERDCCIKMSIHSTISYGGGWSWWWFESSHMPRNCWSIHKTMKKFHLKENLMLNQLCHLSPQWTQTSFTQWTKFTIKSHYFFFRLFWIFFDLFRLCKPFLFLVVFTIFMDLYDL